MIKIKEGDNVIDLENLPSNLEIPIKNILPKSKEYSLNSKNQHYNFNFEEVKVNDASASINFSQYDNKILVTVYGPRENKLREKMKNDSRSNFRA